MDAKLFKNLNYTIFAVFVLFIVLWVVTTLEVALQTGSDFLDVLGAAASPYLFVMAALALPISLTNFLSEFYTKKEKVKEDLPITPNLQELLIPNENIARHITPITFNDAEYNCIISNFRILLYTKDHAKLTEITHENIITSSLERVGNKKYGNNAGGAFVLGIGLIIVFLILPQIPEVIAFFPDINNFIGPMMFMGGVGIMEGILFVSLYSKFPNYYIQLKVSDEVFQLFSELDLLENFINVIRTYRFGQAPSAAIPSSTTAAVRSPSISIPDSEDLKFCIHCGAQLRVIATFCDKCGKRQ